MIRGIALAAMLPMLVAAVPAQQRADFAATPDLVAMARDIGPITASAPGPDGDRFVVIERDAAGPPVVTGMGMLARGAALPKPGANAVAVIRTSKKPPAAADGASADAAGIPLFIVNGSKVWEIGRQGGAMQMRAVAPGESPWKPIG